MELELRNDTISSCKHVYVAMTISSKLVEMILFNCLETILVILCTTLLTSL